MTALSIPLRDDHEDYTALVMGNFILGGGFLSSRLATRIRQQEGLSYSVGSQFSADSEDVTGSFFGYAIYAPENAAALQAAFREELDKVVNTEFGKDEVGDAISGFIEYQKNLLTSDRSLAGYLAKGLYLGRTMAWRAALIEKIQQLTPTDIREAMARHIVLDNMTVVMAGDFSKADE